MPDNHNLLLPMFSPMAQPPTKRYRTIVADPPWRYGHSWNAYRGEGQARRVTKESDYPTMTPEEIANLPVGLWAEDRAHLYLWTTQAYIVPAHQIARTWGFDVMNILTWVKRKPKDDNWLGMGTYFRSVAEFVLFGVRDKLMTLHNDQATIFYGPRGGHSEKPQTFYDMVERMSLGPYLDVFARKQRMGWDCFGNEAYNPSELLATLTDEQAEGLVPA